MTHKIILKVAAVLLLSSASAVSVWADEKQGFYLDAGAGRASLLDGTTAETNLGAGYRWSWFGVQADYVDFAKNSTGLVNTPWLGPSEFSFKEHGITADLTGHWNLGDSRFFLDARAGLFFWNEAAKAYYFPTTGPATSEGFRDTGTSWNAGLGVGYDFNQRFSMAVNYDWYNGGDHTVRVPSVSAQVHF
jgi:hypothetical protein